MKKIRRFAFLLTLFLFFTSIVHAAPKLPEPTNLKYVNDYAGILTADTKNKIVSAGEELFKKTGAEVAVAVIDTTGDLSVEEYGYELFKKWGIGTKGKDNGVLLLVAVEDRKLRIEVGYGLEGILPDGKTGRISDEYILPHFKNGDYDSGILSGYYTLVKETAKEYNVELKLNEDVNYYPQNRVQTEVPVLPIAIAVIIFLLFDGFMFRGRILRMILYIIFNSRGPRGGGWSGGGGFGGKSGGGGFGGGSSGGGGSSRSW